VAEDPLAVDPEDELAGLGCRGHLGALQDRGPQAEARGLQVEHLAVPADQLEVGVVQGCRP